MAYLSRQGKRPPEYASRSSHSNLVLDAEVKEFLSRCEIPSADLSDVDIGALTSKIEATDSGKLSHVIAVDGGYTEAFVRKEFPSARVAFFQFGALSFSLDDLRELSDEAFISPEDMARLKNLERLKLVLPVSVVALKGESTLTHSVRRAIYDFFCKELGDSKLIETLQWLIFEEFGKMKDKWQMASCPYCGGGPVDVFRQKIDQFFTFECGKCGQELFLTDILRLHEAIDDELGAGGILGYVTTAVEQLIIFHLIKEILKFKPALLNNIVFIRDGPLAFFGQTANLHQPARALIKYLKMKHSVYMVGLEKSGAFVEHADEISRRMPNDSVLVLGNKYIYKHILPAGGNVQGPYGSTTYYSSKLIFRSSRNRMYVASLPTLEAKEQPEVGDYIGLRETLTVLEALRCDMYDNALVPVALVNRLVSLSAHPSTGILEKFAVAAMGEQ